MKKALTSENSVEKQRMKEINSYKERTFDDLTEEDKAKLLKFLLEKTDLIKKS